MFLRRCPYSDSCAERVLLSCQQGTTKSRLHFGLALHLGRKRTRPLLACHMKENDYGFRNNGACLPAVWYLPIHLLLRANCSQQRGNVPTVPEVQKGRDVDVGSEHVAVRMNRSMASGS